MNQEYFTLLLAWMKSIQNERSLSMDQYMQLAIREARAALENGNYPFGAVLVRGDKIIGIGRNHMNTHNDPTSHAEMEAMRAAGLQENYANTVI